MIYLDNNASTKISSKVIARMHDLMQMRLANPSSQHGDGRKARHIVEQARDTLLRVCGARTVGMESDQLLFTSGGTEANNLAIFGLSDLQPGAIVVSAIEHPSVLESVTHAASQGRPVHLLPVDQNGVTCLESLQSLLDRHHQGAPIALVSIMLANNETGVLQPVQEAARMCRRSDVLIHTDAVQVLGKVELDFASLDVDAMTVTAHKIHGPIGIGGLVLRHGIQLAPRSFGGFQQLGLRPGTEMPVLAGGFEEAVV
ncbi:MAG: cysteine desulfurase family protein, partial [Pirellula sp.]